MQAGVNHPLYGTHQTEAQNKKQSELMKGRPSPMKGKSRSLEANKKQSISMMGKTHWNKNKKVSEAFCKKNSEVHIGLQSKENHPLWLGGISFLPYCYKFNKELKEAVRKRDNYTCQNPCCQLTQEE